MTSPSVGSARSRDCCCSPFPLLMGRDQPDKDRVEWIMVSDLNQLKHNSLKYVCMYICSVLLLNQNQHCNLHWVMCVSVNVELHSQWPHWHTSWDWDSLWNSWRDPPEPDDCWEDLSAPNTAAWQVHKQSQNSMLSSLVIMIQNHGIHLVSDRSLWIYRVPKKTLRFEKTRNRTIL